MAQTHINHCPTRYVVNTQGDSTHWTIPHDASSYSWSPQSPVRECTLNKEKHSLWTRCDFAGLLISPFTSNHPPPPSQLQAVIQNLYASLASLRYVWYSLLITAYATRLLNSPSLPPSLPLSEHTHTYNHTWTEWWVRTLPAQCTSVCQGPQQWWHLFCREPPQLQRAASPTRQGVGAPVWQQTAVCLLWSPRLSEGTNFTYHVAVRPSSKVLPPR